MDGSIPEQVNGVTGSQASPARRCVPVHAGGYRVDQVNPQQPGFRQWMVVAEFEDRHQRAKEKHMDRPPSLTPAQQKEAIRRRAQGATLDELARSYDLSRASLLDAIEPRP